MAVIDNLLVTGSPRSGDTTVIQRVRERLEDYGYVACRIHCPDWRSNGNRVGFEIVNVFEM